MASTEARVTQRAPQSCQRCSAKKLRCSKTVPCDQCLKLGIDAECRREPVIVSKKVRAPRRTKKAEVAVNQHVHSTVSTPRALDIGHGNSGENVWRSAETRDGPCNFDVPDQAYLSPALSTTTGIGAGLITPHSTHSPSLSFSSPSSSALGRQITSEYAEKDAQEAQDAALDDNVLAENAATTLEFLAWGRQRDVGVSPTNTATFPCPKSPSEILSYYQAKRILEFHRDFLTWMHNTIHWPTFQNECQSYWRDGYVEEDAWLAIYYALLCVQPLFYQFLTGHLRISGWPQSYDQ